MSNLLFQFDKNDYFQYFISWLLVSTNSDSNKIFKTLKNLSIGIDSDVTVATSFLQVDEMLDLIERHWNKTCKHLRGFGHAYNYQMLHDVRKNRALEPDPQHHLKKGERISAFYLESIYRIRSADNATFVRDPLGSWNPGSKLLRKPTSPKLRTNFRNVSIVFGLLNSTMEDSTVDRGTYENLFNTSGPLIELMEILQKDLNASGTIILHNKLGVFTSDAWSDLLGDVVSGKVDVGIAYVVVDEHHQKYMNFSHPLARFKRNVYYSLRKFGSARNIFLQPFNNELLLCVFMTLILIVVAMELINYITVLIRWNEDLAHVGWGEASLWCISIMCMQGSPWTPRTRAGKAVLFASLIFALVVYNAYAGFITSILSVNANDIKNITDFQKHNYKIGSSHEDDEYIRKNSRLRDFYVEALKNLQSDQDEYTGLQKAARGTYAFFVVETVGRRALRTKLVQDRCSLKELILDFTDGILALPIKYKSHYRKVINYSILRMWEHGVLKKLEENIKPAMLSCQSRKTFHSAQLNDVFWAFAALAGGAIGALVIFIFERLWAKRQVAIDRIVKRVKRKKRCSKKGRGEGIVLPVQIPLRILGFHHMDNKLRHLERLPSSRLSKKSERKSRLRKPIEGFDEAVDENKNKFNKSHLGKSNILPYMH